MDLWNNAAGRDIGARSTSAGDSARRVANALGNGSLITSPEDPRKHDSKQPPPDDKPPEEACCEECGASHPLPPPPPEPGVGGIVVIDDSMPGPITPETPGFAPDALQASLDSALALIADMRVDAALFSPAPLLGAEAELALEAMAPLLRDNHERDIAAV